MYALNQRQDLPLGPYDMLLHDWILSNIVPILRRRGGGNCEINWRGCGRINGGTWVMELAADSREPALGKGARSTSARALEVEHTHPGVDP
jgi:hypothetical protein